MKKILGFILSLGLLLTIVYSPDIATEGGDSSLEVHFLDVGQADSILIQNDGINILIDGGKRSTSEKLVNYLKEQGVKDIKYIIATHPHEDHIGGLIGVLDNFDVENIMMPNVISNTIVFEDLLDAIGRKNLEIEKPVVGHRLDFDDMNLKVLAPNSEKYSLTNDYSISLKLVHGKNSFLFTGDAEKKSEGEMLEEHGKNLKSDVLKAGHHGSKTSSNEEFLDAVDPEYAVISVGESSAYDHPSLEVLERFDEREIKLYRTDQDGDIVARSDGKKITFIK